MTIRTRGSGEGSIYRRKDGRWAASLSLGYEGTRRVRKTYYGKTRAEVADKLNRAISDQRNGLPLADERQTLEAYLAWWVATALPGRVRPSTRSSYESNIRLHILPTIGQLAVARVRAMDVQHLINLKLEEGLSPRTVQYIHAILRRALSDAEKWGAVPRNVAKLVDPPKVSARTAAKPLSVAEARSLLEAATNHRLYALYAVALACGLRRGEALALRWTDVDLERRMLTVARTVGRIDGKLTFSEPKSHRSNRTIVLPDICGRALQAHRAHQAKERLAARRTWTETDLVFPSTVGTVIEPRNLTRQFHSLCEEAGIGRRRFHDLRHTCATLLLAQGVSPRVAMEILGHSRISTTMEIYSHVGIELQHEAAGKIDSALA
ncbi:tyrosine-type recombinase/integrase [Actinomycetota bacterium]